MEAQQSISTRVNSFLQRHQNKIAKDFAADKCRIQLLDSQSEEDLANAAARIREGQLVAFPTETVYGLGANALDSEAVKKIFYSKRRPFTDPVIVHVTSVAEALQLVQLDNDLRTRQIFEHLSTLFWPGPLTFILPANFERIDRVVTAGTDFVGVRWPRSQIAQKLIRAAGRPIAAPSANLFSHVSPTSAVHVFNDFFDQEEVAILEGFAGEEACEFGVESTVVKIVAAQNEVQILRYGSVSEKQLAEALQTLQGTAITLRKTDKKVLHNAGDTQKVEGQEAPGQLLRHYAPNIASFLLQVSEEVPATVTQSSVSIKEAILLDFNAKANFLADKCLNYAQMSEGDDLREVMKKLYDLLRWAENVPHAKCILIYDVQTAVEGTVRHEFLDTVFDKIFRSTEGKRKVICKSDFTLYDIA